MKGLLLFVLFVPALAAASDWKTLGQFGEGETLQVDVSSLSTRNVYDPGTNMQQRLETVWVKMIYPKPVNKVSEYVQHLAISCAFHVFAIDSYQEYDVHGNSLKDQSQPIMIMPTQPIPPDTAFDKVQEYVCSAAFPTDSAPKSPPKA